MQPRCKARAAGRGFRPRHVYQVLAVLQIRDGVKHVEPSHRLHHQIEGVDQTRDGALAAPGTTSRGSKQSPREDVLESEQLGVQTRGCVAPQLAQQLVDDRQERALDRAHAGGHLDVDLRHGDWPRVETFCDGDVDAREQVHLRRSQCRHLLRQTSGPRDTLGEIREAHDPRVGIALRVHRNQKGFESVVGNAMRTQHAQALHVPCRDTLVEYIYKDRARGLGNDHATRLVEFDPVLHADVGGKYVHKRLWVAAQHRVVDMVCKLCISADDHDQVRRVTETEHQLGQHPLDAETGPHDDQSILPIAALQNGRKERRRLHFRDII
eukprot:PhM_4_TR9630/c0_g1_i1/m.76314